MRTSRRRWWLVALGALVVAPAVADQVRSTAAEAKEPPAAPQKTKAKTAPKLDTDSERMLRQMTDYLAGLKQFRLRSASVDEVETTTGQKVQVAGDSDVAVRRPNGLMSAQIGSPEGLALFYDGKTITLYCKMDNTYGTVAAPPTIDAMIDLVRSKYGIDAPGADLIYSHPYDILTEQVTGGQYLGRETIDTVLAHHLAFTGEEVDWQVWIKDGPEPLPLRFVVTTKTMKTQPQFTIQLSHWEPQATVPDAAFKFPPPADATRVESLPTKCGSRARKPEKAP